MKRIFFTLIFLIFCNYSYSEETITLLNYYPSPRGIYKTLSVIDTENDTELTVYNYSDLNTVPVLSFKKARGTIDAPAVLIEEDIGRINFSGYINGGFFPFASIFAGGNVSQGDGTYSSRIVFRTSTHQDGLRDRLVINYDGHVGVGTSIPGNMLHIKKDQDDFTGIRIENVDEGANSSEGIYFTDEDGTIGGIRLYDDNNAVYPSEMAMFNNRPNGSINFVTLDTMGDVNPDNDVQWKMVMNNNGDVEFRNMPSVFYENYFTGAIDVKDEWDDCGIFSINVPSAGYVVVQVHGHLVFKYNPRDAGSVYRISTGIIDTDVIQAPPNGAYVNTDICYEPLNGIAQNMSTPFSVSTVYRVDQAGPKFFHVVGRINVNYKVTVSGSVQVMYFPVGVDDLEIQLQIQQVAPGVIDGF